MKPVVPSGGLTVRYDICLWSYRMQHPKPRLRINSEDVDCGPPSSVSMHSCDSDSLGGIALDSDPDPDLDKSLTNLLEDFHIEFDTTAVSTV